MFYISVEHKIKKENLTNIKNLINMTRYKISWRKSLESAPVLKKWDWVKFPNVLTRSALRELLFNS